MYSLIVSDSSYLFPDSSLANTLLDHPEEVDGAPCAIQIVTPRFQDEKCLAAAELIEQAIWA